MEAIITANAPTKPIKPLCVGCGGELTIIEYAMAARDNHLICMGCVKARHRAAISHKCSCPKKLKRPREVTNKIRQWIACDRCLGAIKQLN